jgi:small-conductance mechanosensitive channel
MADTNELLLAFLAFFSKNALGILVSAGIILAISQVAIEIVNKKVKDERKAHAMRKWIRYLAAIFCVVWLIVLYSAQTERSSPLYLLLIGLFLAGIAISMRDVFSNVVGWFLIMSHKGFKQGDRIKVGNITGDVIDIGLLRTMLAEIGGWVKADQSTGRLVSIPNSMIISNEIYNFTQGYEYIWDEISILVTYESDWRRAEKIITEIAMKDFEEKKEHIQEKLKMVRSKYLLRYNFISPKVYVRIADSGVELTLRYMVPARRRRTAQDTINREILAAFSEEKTVELAYPTIRQFRMYQDKRFAEMQRGTEPD